MNRLEKMQAILKWNLVSLFVTEAEIVGEYISGVESRRMPGAPIFHVPMISAEISFEYRQTTARYYQGETRGGDINLTYQPLSHVPKSDIQDGVSKDELISRLERSEEWVYQKTVHDHMLAMRDHARSELISSFPNELLKEAIQYCRKEHMGTNLASIAEFLDTSETYAHQVERRPDKAKVSQKTRKQILERDDHECVVCSKSDDLHVYHIRPAAKGGTGDKHNLAVVCASCHAEIHRNDIDTKSKFSEFATQWQK